MNLRAKSLVCLLAAALSAVSTYGWSLVGRVKCPDRAPVPEVVIFVSGSTAAGAFSSSGITDFAGNYFVDLPDLPGTYVATLDQTSLPFGATVVGPSSVPFETTPLDTSVRVDWEVGPCGVTPPPAAIGNFVWLDLNVNGLQDAGEPGVPGVQVTLYDCAGNALSVQLTDANGLYLFEVPAGNYQVGFTLPPGYAFSPQDQGGNDETDSDASPTTGMTVCTTLSPGETDLSWDAGIHLPCQLGVTKACLIPPPPPAPFNCSGAKPINSITVIWAGAQTIGVKAWKGPVGTSTLLATMDNIAPGTSVTVTGYAGSPNDVYWEIFAGTTAGAKLGESTFHLSCSDEDMNGPEDCGKPAGDGKARAGFINQWRFEGMAGNGVVLSCTPASPTPATDCTVVESPFASCEALGKPTSLTFRYTGGGCAAGNNPQSGKFICSGAINPALAITIASANGYGLSKTIVLPGEEFTVSAGSFAAQSLFTLNNAGGTESLSIHTSCSQPLSVGDVFGSLTLVGFNGQSGGSSVIYRYTVQNTGPSPAHGVMLTDDQLGDIAGPFNLAAGESRTFDVPVQLEETTVNVATAFIPGQNCQASSGPVTVTVLRNCPVPVPGTTTFDCSSMKPINSLSMIWSGAQVIGIKAWKGPVGTSTLLATIDNIAPGDVVTVTGYAGSPNDVYWEIFDGTTAGPKLGESTFHVSCSDDDMDGPEDCGKLAGDGKARLGFLNLWTFEGMAGNGQVIGCSAPPAPLPTAVISGKTLQWPLANLGSSKLTLTGLSASWPATNKKLVKVKLDGDVVWDVKSAAGATSITLDVGDLTNDTKKKSIDPGKTRKLILEFEADASKNLSAYTLQVSFGRCVLSLW